MGSVRVVFEARPFLGALTVLDVGPVAVTTKTVHGRAGVEGGGGSVSVSGEELALTSPSGRNKEHQKSRGLLCPLPGPARAPGHHHHLVFPRCLCSVSLS